MKKMSSVVEQVRASVRAAYRKVWGTTYADAHKAVLHPADTHRGSEDGIATSEAVIFTEHAGLSQYDNDDFWIALRKELAPHGLYYEWYDGGTATIWPTYVTRYVVRPFADSGYFDVIDTQRQEDDQRFKGRELAERTAAVLEAENRAEWEAEHAADADE